MATITGQSLVTKAQTLIQDNTGVRWPRDELLGYLNDGQREVVLLRPEASVTNASKVLTANSTKQSLPADAVMLIDVPRNMGAAGTTAGRVIRIVSREILDAQYPNWHVDANAGGDIRHFTYDPRDPKTFYVYPKSPATSLFVELVYASSPVATDDAGAVIGIDDIYANALVDYILYRAYSKDAEYAQNSQLAVAYYTAFANALGIKTNTDLQRNPNMSALPFNPNVPGSAKV